MIVLFKNGNQVIWKEKFDTNLEGKCQKRPKHFTFVPI